MNDALALVGEKLIPAYEDIQTAGAAHFSTISGERWLVAAEDARSKAAANRMIAFAGDRLHRCFARC